MPKSRLIPQVRPEPLFLSTLGAASMRSERKRYDLERRQIGILAYLADARPKRISRDELASVFWPQVPRTKARHSLAQAIHLIRNAEPNIDLSGDGDLIGLGPTVSWDVESVRSLLASGELQGLPLVLCGPSWVMSPSLARTILKIGSRALLLG